MNTWAVCYIFLSYIHTYTHTITHLISATMLFCYWICISCRGAYQRSAKTKLQLNSRGWAVFSAWPLIWKPGTPLYFSSCPEHTFHYIQTTGNNTPCCSSHLLLASRTKAGTVTMPCNQPARQVMRAHEYVWRQSRNGRRSRWLTNKINNNNKQGQTRNP